MSPPSALVYTFVFMFFSFSFFLPSRLLFSLVGNRSFPRRSESLCKARCSIDERRVRGTTQVRRAVTNLLSSCFVFSYSLAFVTPRRFSLFRVLDIAACAAMALAVRG